MLTVKYLNFRGVMSFTGRHLVWMTLWIGSVELLYKYADLEWLRVPPVLMSVIGTAVAFYVGFKNNQSYDRLWEARKIWGAIVNSSRSWGSSVRSFVSDDSSVKGASGSAVDQPLTEIELKEIHRVLIYRQIAWLYALRSQLLLPAPWEHLSQRGWALHVARRRYMDFGLGLMDASDLSDQLNKFLSEREFSELGSANNTATQIIDKQSQQLADLFKAGRISEFKQIALQDLLKEFYVQQGMCERIKKTPFPRQYGGMSLIFVGLFILMLPFSTIPEFRQLHAFGEFVAIPFTVIVGWLYVTMELIGDYSENPFAGLGNDVPMLALCRTIEIDLRQMLGETDLPDPIEAKNGVLM